jgi:hypothetical protein
MRFFPLQQSWRTAYLALWPRRERYQARRPKCGRRLDANLIAKIQCYKLSRNPLSSPYAESASTTPTGTSSLNGERICQRNIRLGLEAYLLGDAGLLTSLLVTCPRLAEVELISRRTDGLFGGKRYAHRQMTVFLLAQLPAVLAGDSNRMSSLLRKPGVINDPGNQRMLSRNGWKQLVANPYQNSSIALPCPRSLIHS